MFVCINDWYIYIYTWYMALLGQQLLTRGLYISISTLGWKIEDEPTSQGCRLKYTTTWTTSHSGEGFAWFCTIERCWPRKKGPVPEVNRGRNWLDSAGNLQLRGVNMGKKPSESGVSSNSGWTHHGETKNRGFLPVAHPRMILEV